MDEMIKELIFEMENYLFAQKYSIIYNNSSVRDR